MSAPSASIPAWIHDLHSRVQFYRVAGTTLYDVVVSGQRPTLRPGRGLEWSGIREYQPGDPFNLISWRMAARYSDAESLHLFSRTFDAEVANLTTIVIDCSASMDTWTGEGKLATALGVASLLAWASANYGDPVEISWVSAAQPGSYTTTNIMYSATHYETEMDHMNQDKCTAMGEGPWDLLMDHRVGLKGTRHTLVLISDFFANGEVVAAAVREIRRYVRTILAVRIQSRSDRHPFRKGDVELYDVEVPSKRIRTNLLTPRAQKMYTDKLKIHNQEIRGILEHEGIPLADLDAVPEAGPPLRKEEILQTLPERLIEANILIRS